MEEDHPQAIALKNLLDMYNSRLLAVEACASAMYAALCSHPESGNTFRQAFSTQLVLAETALLSTEPDAARAAKLRLELRAAAVRFRGTDRK